MTLCMLGLKMFGLFCMFLGALRSVLPFFFLWWISSFKFYPLCYCHWLRLSYFLINYLASFLQMCEEERSGSDFRSSSMLSNLQKSNPEKFQRCNFLMSYFQSFLTSCCFHGKMSIWDYYNCLWFLFENSFGFSSLCNLFLSFLGEAMSSSMHNYFRPAWWLVRPVLTSIRFSQNKLTRSILLSPRWDVSPSQVHPW